MLIQLCARATFSVKKTDKFAKIVFHQSTKEDKRNGVTVYMKAILKNPLFHGFNVSVNTKKVKRDKYVKIRQLYSLFFRKWVFIFQGIFALNLR